MTDTEIIERVEAWIRDAVPRIRATHSGADVDLGGLPRAFGRAIFEWREVSSRWGPAGGAACGALLALVREAWDDPRADLVWGGSMWVCSVRHDGVAHRFADHVEVLAALAALEAAPR